jgi:hypothetical protein
MQQMAALISRMTAPARSTSCNGELAMTMKILVRPLFFGGSAALVLFVLISILAT